LAEIYERARTQEEIESELKKLRDDTESRKQRFEDELERTAGIIESRFHDQVKQRFKDIQARLPGELAELDQRLEQVAVSYLQSLGVPYEIVGEEHGDSRSPRRSAARRVLVVGESVALPEGIQKGFRVSLNGAGSEDAIESLHAEHPLIKAAVAAARAATQEQHTVTIATDIQLSDKRGLCGLLVVERVQYRLFEDFERLLVAAVLDDETILVGAEAEPLLKLSMTERKAFEPPLTLDPELVDDALDEALFLDQESVGDHAEGGMFVRIVALSVQQFGCIKQAKVEFSDGAGDAGCLAIAAHKQHSR
jgi:hypothetical protein